MESPKPLRGAMDVGAMGSTLRAASSVEAGSTMELSHEEARIIFWRNMTILLLSLVVGTKTLGAILSGWRHTHYSPVRKFTNTLMAILLGLEVVNTVIWIVGVNLAGSVDGSVPWSGLSAERADRVCFPFSVVNYWLDPMVFFWHAIMAYFIWAWVVRERDVGTLQSRIPLAFGLAAAVSTGMTVVPIYNDNLGLWPHSDCFVRKSWSGPRTPATGVMLDRMILMPICWLAILVFNAWTIIHLRGETGQFMVLTSVKRLQLRLVLITAAFIVIWGLMSIPLYANKRTFALEFGVKWAFAIGFVDAMIYGYPGTVQCLRPCMPSLRNIRLSLRFWSPESERQLQQRRQEPERRQQRTTSFWETFMPDVGGGSPSSYSDSASSGGPRSHYWHPGRLPRRMSTEPGRGSGASLLSFRPWARGKPSSLQPYHIFATAFDMNLRCLPLQGGRRDCDESTGGVCPPPTSSATTCELDPVLQRGLEAWIPARTTGGAQYHLYVIAVQRCRVVGRLRQIIHAHLGGSAHYVVAGSAEIGDALTGRTAILLFARTVDVESGAFRIVASNQRPVVLRSGVRGGVKGVLGMAFSYYDTTVAVVNAHLPATSLYAGASASVSPLEEREKHIGSMLHDLRIGAGHQMWDTHLQYHHVILLGNLNYRMRLPPDEMIERIQQASIACQARFEEEHELLRGGVGLEWSWRRGAGYNRFWALCDPELLLGSPGSVPFLHGRYSSTIGPGSDAGGWGIGLADISEVVEHQGGHPRDRSSCEDRRSPQPLEAPWAWVKERDVLCQRMSKGGLLHGFREAPISFPPSFKFRVDASAEDYTERRVLEAAYVTGPRRANAYPQWSPSYTDRILVHSLADIEHRCILGAYDMCDEGPLALISDHRPVSLNLAVIIDTSQLPSVDTLGRGSRRKSRSTSETANAMAFATTQQQHARHRQARSFSRIEQLLLQRQPSSGPRAFPLLVCMAFSHFRFNFRGFDVMCDRSMHGASMEEVKEAAAHAEEGKGGEEGRPPAEPLPQQASCMVADRGKEPPRAKSWLRLPSFISESAGGARRREAQQPAAGAASQQEAEEGHSIVDHVLLLYPLPCEDPLAPIRRAQLFGESLQALPLTELLEPTHHPSTGEQERGSQQEAGGDRPSRMLQNLYRVDWRPGFEEPDPSPHRTFSGLLSLAASTVETECEQPGKASVTEDSMLIDVLTLGPPRPMQHALLKFVGKRGKELGQACFCIGELLINPRGESVYSRCSSPASRLGPPPGTTTRRQSSTGVVATRHTLDLTLGGQFKGTVSFDLGVKAKRRARREGEALQRTMEETRSGGGSGSGSGGGGRRTGGGGARP